MKTNPFETDMVMNMPYLVDWAQQDKYSDSEPSASEMKDAFKSSGLWSKGEYDNDYRKY